MTNFASRRFKTLLVEPPVYGANIPASEYAPSGLRFLRTSDITDGGQLDSAAAVYVAPETVAPEHLLQDGDVLISRSGTVGRSAIYRSSWGPCTHAGYLVRLRLRDSVDGQFISYVTQSKHFQAAIERDTIQSTIGNFNAQKMGELSVPFRPPGEQKAVVRFLDEETAKINALIEKNSHLHALLLEEADAFLTLELWPDPLPDGWSMTPLMRLTQPSRPIMYGIVLPGPNVPEGVPLVKGGDVSNNRMHPNLLNKTTLEIEAPYARARLSGGDVLLTIRGRYGDAALVPDVMGGANITQDIARIAPRPEIDSKWLLRVLQSQPIVRKMFNEALGAAVQGVNIRDVKRYQVPLPPPAEQGRLASEIDDRLTTIEEAANSLAQATARLREYRSALITAAVTGHIDIGSAA